MLIKEFSNHSISLSEQEFVLSGVQVLSCAICRRHETLFKNKTHINVYISL